jgi:hypothetical protein
MPARTGLFSLCHRVQTYSIGTGGWVITVWRLVKNRKTSPLLTFI